MSGLRVSRVPSPRIMKRNAAGRRGSKARESRPRSRDGLTTSSLIWRSSPLLGRQLPEHPVDLVDTQRVLVDGVEEHRVQRDAEHLRRRRIA